MIYTAYANSADGTKDFTKVRPKPNLYNSSLLNSAPSIIVEETGFKLLGGWATPVINHANLRKILKVGHTYHFSYDFELLTLQEGTVPHTQYQHTTLFLYSTKDSRNYPGIMLTQYSTSSDNLELINNLRVGDIVHHTKSVAIPECVGDVFADYRILAYGRRSMNPDGTLNRVEDGRFMNIKIEDSQTGETVYLQNAIDNLGKSYMRYIGTSNTDSNNPSDYTWKLNLVGEARHTITPENATVKDVTYSVADKSVVTITQNDDHTGVLLSPESYGKTILTAKTVDSGKIANLTVNTIKTLNLDHSNRISLSPVGDAHKILTDIRNSGTVNLLKGTGDARGIRVYSVRSNNSSVSPITSEDIVESDTLAYARVRRAKLEDGTWGSKSFSLYMAGAPVEQWATEDFIGTGYWFSVMIRSNIELTISKSKLSVREFTGGTDYGRADTLEDISLEADKWKMIKVWVPESEESARLATNIRFILWTRDLTDTQLATTSLDISRPMVSKEEPYYWLPAPEDVGVPHGQPNLANNTFKDWKSYTFTYWRPDGMLRSINPVDLGLSVGDVLTVKSEITNPADSNVTLGVEIAQIHEGVRIGGTPNKITSGTSGTSVASLTVKNLENPIQVGEIVKSDSSTTVTGAQARRLKLIKGDKTLMDFWTPSFADFSAGKYLLNPYFEVSQENYSKLTTTAELTNTTKIIGTKAETQIVFDTVNTVRDYFPREFSGLTTNESILVKFATIVKSIKVVIPFKGVSSTRTYAERGIISNTGEYNGISTNVTTNLDSREHVLTSNYAPYIQQDMTMKYFVCTDATNGLVASSVTVGKPVQTVIVQPSENPNGEAVEITVSPKV